MKSKRLGYTVFIFTTAILVLVLILAFFYGKSKEPVKLEDSCQSDSDCVPAQCCHPTTAVNTKYAPECVDMMCTSVCSGPLDCGAGKLMCVDKKCRIVPSDN